MLTIREVIGDDGDREGRKEEGGRRQEEGGRRKEEGGRRQET
jgi:hypothetical protein